MEKKHMMTCNRCQVELTLLDAGFEYLGHSFRAKTMRCPNCGQVFISEELAKGRIAEVQMELEDK